MNRISCCVCGVCAFAACAMFNEVSMSLTIVFHHNNPLKIVYTFTWIMNSATNYGFISMATEMQSHNHLISFDYYLWEIGMQQNNNCWCESRDSKSDMCVSCDLQTISSWIVWLSHEHVWITFRIEMCVHGYGYAWSEVIFMVKCCRRWCGVRYNSNRYCSVLSEIEPIIMKSNASAYHLICVQHQSDDLNP